MEGTRRCLKLKVTMKYIQTIIILAIEVAKEMSLTFIIGLPKGSQVCDACGMLR